MNRQFTALSGLAMILIVLNHTIEMGTKVPVGLGFPALEGPVRIALNLVQGLGVFAVPTFLFISGAFVAYAARGEPPRLTLKFISGSLSHIAWPYLLWSALFYVVVFLQFGESYTSQGYLKNIVVGYPFHFIPLLLMFYILSPLLVVICRRHEFIVLGCIFAGQLFLMTVLHTGALPRSMTGFVPPVVGRTLADWAIYFPLGLVYGLYMKTALPPLRRVKRWMAAATFFLFVLGALHWIGIIRLPLASYLSPLPLVLLLPAIERGSIPMVDRLERVGKRSYGLYLTHLLVLDLTLLALATLAPAVLGFQLALLPVLFVIALQLPLILMNALARSRARVIYRYILG
jgi:peptidoglycan/LPS O-acetylase OafA/YrhL